MTLYQPRKAKDNNLTTETTKPACKVCTVGPVTFTNPKLVIHEIGPCPKSTVELFQETVQDIQESRDALIKEAVLTMLLADEHGAPIVPTFWERRQARKDAAKKLREAKPLVQRPLTSEMLRQQARKARGYVPKRDRVEVPEDPEEAKAQAVENERQKRLDFIKLLRRELEVYLREMERLAQLSNRPSMAGKAQDERDVMTRRFTRAKQKAEWIDGQIREVEKQS